ncbi:MAG TPA: response regulator transcription factor [Desulfocapsa sulfexigens]|nr:response regulator transcription factor [Desulfocapsa sulfexigens]
MEKLSVIIVDDHPVIRHGVSSVLRQQPDMNIVGQLHSAEAALPEIKNLKPDVAILDITMAGISGIDLIPYIKESSEDTAIIIYTMHEMPDYIHRAFSAGAKGYVLKGDEINDLIAAIREVKEERFYFSRNLPHALVQQIMNGNGTQGPLSGLTAREYEIANLLAQNMNPNKIGEILFISPKTVRVHRTNIMHKLGCQRSNELLFRLRDYFPNIQ